MADRILSNTEIWNLVRTEVSPAARTWLEKAVEPVNPPPLLAFLLAAVEGISCPLSSLLLNTVVPAAIANPAVLGLEDALQLARSAVEVDSGLDHRILRHLARPSRTWPSEVPNAEIMRVLIIIDAISGCERLVLPLTKFAKLSQPHLRSKAVKLLARAHRSTNWASLILKDPNPRVRSNLIEEIAGQIGVEAGPLLRKGAEDPHHRVATTSLLALTRLGDQNSRQRLEDLALNGDEMTRRAAAWALGQLETNPSTSSPHPTV